MKPIEAFQKLIGRFLIFTEAARRWKNEGPGKVVESMPPEIREGLTQLKSDDIGPDTVVKDYLLWGDDYSSKQEALRIEKEFGIQPPPRKKYDEFG